MKVKNYYLTTILVLMGCSSASLVVKSPDSRVPVSLSPYVAIQDSGKLFQTGSIIGEASQIETFNMLVLVAPNAYTNSYDRYSKTTEKSKGANHIPAAIAAATGDNPSKAIQNAEITLGTKAACFYMLLYVTDKETAFAELKGDLVQTLGDSL